MKLSTSDLNIFSNKINSKILDLIEKINQNSYETVDENKKINYSYLPNGCFIHLIG